MRIVSVPCLKDNFAYLVIDDDGRCAVVDPGEAAPVEAALAREHARLAAVWATHHHPDHVGGIGELVARHGGVEVVIGVKDAARTPHVTHRVDDGDEVALGSLRARCIHNPGHTLGAVTYVVDGCAFTGDTLFSAGCGKLFEGDAAMMHASLMRLAALPPDTRVYFGHEYTATNLRFAAAVEPDNRPRQGAGPAVDSVDHRRRARDQPVPARHRARRDRGRPGARRRRRSGQRVRRAPQLEGQLPLTAPSARI